MSESYEADFLVERPEGQRIWVVRASGGAYLGHFSEHNLIAIGHVDILQLSEGKILPSTLDKLQQGLQTSDPERAKSSISSHVNQVRTFVSLIKEDDLIVTVNSARLSVGRVAGEAYVDHQPLKIVRGDNVFEMKHNVRRPVVWGPSIARKSVPAALEMTMLAHQTIFNIDEYWDSIYHLLYPCFHYDGKLYLSANIKQTNALDNFSLSQFFLLLSGIEAMAKEMSSDGDEWRNYPEFSDAQLERLDLSLTTKAEFMSPGAIWASLAADGGALLWACAIYIMLFGGDIKILKTDGLIDIKTRQKIWDRVIKLMDTHNFPRLKGKLKIDVPRADTKALEPSKPRKPRASKAQVKLVATDADREHRNDESGER